MSDHNKMVGWIIRRPDYSHVDTLYYAEDCDEDYIRRAEDIPADYTMTVDE